MGFERALLPRDLSFAWNRGCWKVSLFYDSLKAIRSTGGGMAQVTITVRKNGSLKVDDPNGVVEMVDGDGNRYDLTGKTAFSLCRCGASANRPFCDGSHNKIGFQAAETAIKTPQS
jgi:CDGSH-type Zn-finger protein